jgi:hypothetical protein
VNLAIDVEDVLPGLAVDGARLDLGQVGAEGGEFESAATSEPGRFSTEKAMLILFASGSGPLRRRRTRKKRV